MRYLLLFFFLPLHCFCQDISGLWVGEVNYDTAKHAYHYEIAISGEADHYTGYALTLSLPDSVYNVKSIKVIKKQQKVFFDEEGLLYNKIKTVDLPDRVRQVDMLTISQRDTLLVLNGGFITTLTRAYRHHHTGTVILQKTNIIKDSKLLHILDSLNITKDLTFLNPKEKPVVEVPKKEEKPVIIPPPPVVDKEVAIIKPVEKPKPTPPPVVVKKDTIAVVVKPKPLPPPVKKDTVAVVIKPKVITPIIKKDTVAAIIKHVEKPRPVPPPPPVVKKVVVAAKPVEKPKAPPPPVVVTKPVVIPPAKGAHQDVLEGLTKRKIETISTLYFTADSLKMQIYDNGFVDGDSVSVIINGVVVLAHQRLTEIPIEKWIHISDFGDTLKVVMYAENLGSIPPNTGMLSIYDGFKRYDVEFSGDLVKNAAISLQRKR